eukprot:6491616-Amphidinium_carterae.2
MQDILNAPAHFFESPPLDAEEKKTMTEKAVFKSLPRPNSNPLIVTGLAASRDEHARERSEKVHRKKVQLDASNGQGDWLAERTYWFHLLDQTFNFQVLNHTTRLTYSRKIIQIDHTFLKVRCESIVRACEGQTEEMINWVFAFQGHKDMLDSEEGQKDMLDSEGGAHGPPLEVSIIKLCSKCKFNSGNCDT